MRSFVLAIAALSAAVTLHPGEAAADCSPAGGVHLNEIRFLDGPTPEEGRLNALVELFNKGGAPAALDGWTITDHTGAVKHTLAPLSLPAGAFVIVRFETGTDELDFGDGVGTVYTNGDSVGTFDPSEGGVALYADSLGTPVIRDYVTWSLTGATPAGAALTDAVARGLWTADDFVPRASDQSFFTIRLLPDGFDHDLGSDWVEYGWSESGYGGRIPGSNAIQQAPSNGSGFDPGPVTLAWSAVDSAAAYHLEVATDPTFSSGVLVDMLTGLTDTTIAPASGATYYWRVRIIDSCGELPAGATWGFGVFPFAVAAPGRARDAPLAPQVFGTLAVPRRLQRKDSSLLCIWDDANRRRPGCTEAAGQAGPWDAPHPEVHAEVVVPTLVGLRIVFQRIQCPHCRNYCRRATIQMINHFYGGDLTQDRISYQAMPLERAAGNVVAAPEGDLGHDQTMLVASTGPITQWAVDNSTVTGPFAGPSYAQVKAEIQAGYPVQTRIPGHALVLAGFIDAGSFAFNLPLQNLVLVRDPWPGPGNLEGWQPFPAVNFAGWWRIRPAGVPALAGHMQEATVGTDGDADGVRDFDEGYPTHPADRPRRLQSRHNEADTDRDEVRDKQDIRSYVFHDADHAGHNNDGLNFPDHDFDGLRAELDCDSDEDTDFDGGEDVNGDGRTPVAGETDVWDAASRRIRLATDFPTYTPLDEVTLLGDTYHATSDYTYYVYNACPFPLAPDTPYTGFIATGTISSAADGTLIPALIGHFPPGCYTVAIDIRKDARYGHSVTPPVPAVVSNCDLTTTFSVEDIVAALGSGPFVSESEGMAQVEWEFFEGLTLGSVTVERGREAQGPFEIVATFTAGELAGTPGRYEDATLEEPGRYWYRVVGRTGGEAIVLGPHALDITPPRFALFALPNPAAGPTTIALSLPRAQTARIAVYAANGRLVRELVRGPMKMGRQTLGWDGADASGRRVTAGVYFMVGEAGGRTTQTRIVRL